MYTYNYVDYTQANRFFLRNEQFQVFTIGTQAADAEEHRAELGCPTLPEEMRPESWAPLPTHLRVPGSPCSEVTD